MILIVFVICVVGVIQIFSATLDTASQGAWWKQVVYIVGGVALMWLALNVDYHSMLHYVPMLYLGSVAVLLLTSVVGEATFGSRRWIPLPGGFHFQVSEFVKLVIILLVARFLTDLHRDDLEIVEALKLTGLVSIPAVLVLRQPDLGTALTYFAVLFVGALLAGLHWKYIAAVVVILGLGLSVSSVFLKDYQRQRLVSFMNPDEDPQGTGYHTLQSKIAIGSGGMTGKGFLKGTQSRLRFLPVPSKDFIFSAFAEEQGFVGVVVLLSLYFVLLMRIVQNAQMAPDRAGKYICMGIAALLLCHILVNVGMVAGMMPVTGIPLLFMSFGGSSIWSSFIALGLVNNVRLRRFVN
ncbi:MAG TPA: rod shape-determining protein RodA [Bryobacteraceae bacterium]|nr:rod shape-determining protein RodA [Bryobacteraceae bacterium]